MRPQGTIEEQERERRQLLAEMALLVDKLKSMTGQNADQEWREFGQNLADWNRRAEMLIEKPSP